ncbi:nuclear RNA export factor 5-like [Perognathus longimembris pacificus]|uniref:nuclear RNA export factor 5-like n=1 Tax=Perognathus longimembris pacificus TaxID=214514 RepID=UPI00201909BD|nr:nuclear RNA export factor 5-like [Perognathus longimembris pacificus]
MAEIAQPEQEEDIDRASNNSGNLIQEKEKDGDSFQENSGEENLHYEHEGHENPSSDLQEDDGNKKIPEDHEIRNKLDTLELNSETRQCYDESQDDDSPQKEMKDNAQECNQEDWFKITYDKMWLVNLIQSHSSVPFTPVDFQFIKTRAQFFVQGESTASAFKAIHCKIYDEANDKISIFVNPSSVPDMVMNKFTAEQMEQIKLALMKRYDVTQKSLDLQKLQFDTGLLGHDITMVLNRRHFMAAILQIIGENFPELLSLNLCNNNIYWLDGLSDIVQQTPQVKFMNLSQNQIKFASELDKLKGLQLEELWLEGNPLCNTFADKAAYEVAIQDYFPQLLWLDGQELVSPVIGGDVPEVIKPCKESYRGCESLKSMLLQFLIQSLKDYLKDSRNLKKHKHPVSRMQLLKHTNCEIVVCLSSLPRTQHDFSSYVIDICVQTVSPCFFPQAIPESWKWSSE